LTPKGTLPPTPKGLSTAGKALWKSILGDLEDDWVLDARELYLLERAARCADELKALRWAGGGMLGPRARIGLSLFVFLVLGRVGAERPGVGQAFVELPTGEPGGIRVEPVNVGFLDVIKAAIELGRRGGTVGAVVVEPTIPPVLPSLASTNPGKDQDDHTREEQPPIPGWFFVIRADVAGPRREKFVDHEAYDRQTDQKGQHAAWVIRSRSSEVVEREPGGSGHCPNNGYPTDHDDEAVGSLTYSRIRGHGASVTSELDAIKRVPGNLLLALEAVPLESKALLHRIDRVPRRPFRVAHVDLLVYGRSTGTGKVDAQEDRTTAASISLWRELPYERHGVRVRGALVVIGKQSHRLEHLIRCGATSRISPRLRCRVDCAANVERDDDGLGSGGRPYLAGNNAVSSGCGCRRSARFLLEVEPLSLRRRNCGHGRHQQHYSYDHQHCDHERRRAHRRDPIGVAAA
jgi:hypothetical protein